MLKAADVACVVANGLPEAKAQADEMCIRDRAWVVSVMLPPMAIFFPLFTLLEDLGYLPVSYTHLDVYKRQV